MFKLFNSTSILSTIRYIINLKRTDKAKLIVTSRARNLISDIGSNKILTPRNKKEFKEVIKKAALDCRALNVKRVILVTEVSPEDSVLEFDNTLNYIPWLVIYIKNNNALWLLKDPEKAY